VDHGLADVEYVDVVVGEDAVKARNQARASLPVTLIR